MIDLDHFKQVNDRHGHDAGDRVLRHVADRIRERLRPSDVACRLGGEEFCIFLADTGAEQGRHVADDLRHTIETSPFCHAGQDIALTTSIGIAELGRDGDTLEALFGAADRRLYDAKQAGRNRVVS